MARKNVVIDRIARIEELPYREDPATDKETVLVHFVGGQLGRISPASSAGRVFYDVLVTIKERDAPAYVISDPDSGRISEVLVPSLAAVKKLMPLPGGEIEVGFELSEARYKLSPENPKFEDLLGALLEAYISGAAVFVTDTLNDHEIVDVSLAEGLRVQRANPPLTSSKAPTKPVTECRARDLFDRILRMSCDPIGAASPCLPFLYPDNGCVPRAHEMCAFILSEQEHPKKVWAMGSFNPRTPNHPNCEVTWSLHVAPLLAVSVGGTIQWQAFDPSLFPRPVSREVWLKRLNPSGKFYDLNSPPSATLQEEHHPRVLQECREKLKLRSVCHGPPPYTCC